VVHHSAWVLYNFVRYLSSTWRESKISSKHSEIYIFLTRLPPGSKIGDSNCYHLAIFKSVMDDIMCDGRDIIFFTEPTAFYDNEWLKKLQIVHDQEIHFYNDSSYACTINCAKSLCTQDAIYINARNLRHGLELHGNFEIVLNPGYSHVQNAEQWPPFPIIFDKKITCSYEESYEKSRIELYKVKIQ